MGIRKEDDFKYVWGELDLISAGLVILGIYLVTKTYSIGWVLALLGVLKQFSGK